MSNANVDLVKKAFKACDEGDTETLKGLFVQSDSIPITGAIGCGEPYPNGDNLTELNYNPQDLGNNTVKTRLRFKKMGDPEEYEGEVVDYI